MLAMLAAAAALVTAPAPRIDPLASVPLAEVATEHAPGSCHVRLAANGMQLPDPACTPGAINPTITLEVLLDPNFRTGEERDLLTSADRKKVVYGWYGIVEPRGNKGPRQVCELDHLVSILAGGSDAIENIWPQCQAPGAPAVPVGEREFKIKDAHAELGIGKAIRDGQVTDLADVQKRVTADWTQFLPPGR